MSNNVNHNKIELFVDISGSVSGFKEYWNCVNTFYKENKENINHIYVWDDRIDLISKCQFEEMIKATKGRGGTYPSTIANTIVSRKYNNNIVIFTDGDVSQSEVDKVETLLCNYMIDNVRCYIVSHSKPNLSVTCPFTRNNTSTIYSKEGSSEYVVQHMDKNTYKLLEDLKTITLEQFNNMYDTIEQLLVRKNMGCHSDNKMREIIIAMKKRLVHEMSLLFKSNNENDELRKHLENKNNNEAFKYIKNITDKYFESTDGMTLDKKCNYLISLCEDMRGLYTIDAIRSRKMIRSDFAKVVNEPVIPENPQDFTSKPSECPIMLDNDVMQILINDIGEPILANIDKKIVDDITSCPLRILNYPLVVDKLRKAIGQYNGISTSQHNNVKLNPFTRQTLIGTIPLGNCQQHIECGNYTLAKLFSAGKILGNIHMYMAVIWYLVKNNDIPYLQDIKEMIDEHMVYRLKNSTSTISMCGLPQYVLTRVPTDIALWYVINSCLLEQPIDRETIRYHIFNTNPILQMIELLGYTNFDDAINHMQHIKIMMSMLQICKKNTIEFNNHIQCLKQNYIKVNVDNLSPKVIESEKVVRYVPIDGMPSQEQIDEILKFFPDYYRRVPISTLYAIGNMVNPNLSASDIKLSPYQKYNVVKSDVNWELYKLDEYNPSTTTISLKTFRPFYITETNKQKTWKETLEDYYASLSKYPHISCDTLFSGYKRYIDFYYKYQHFPNKDELLIFCYNRYINKKTLPYLTKRWVDTIINNYTTVRDYINSNNMSPSDVINIFNKYASTKERIKVEYED